ncbi:retrovirus-related pol polyprotein from transposon TNT 1-94 [Tanacetum coccineum]
MEMARSILYEKKLPKTFWAEAVATSVYLLDRLATKVVSGKTPIEAWSGIKPSIQHLKVFGSISYYHIPDIKRSKLDAKARKGIFVGHTTESKGYRIYDLTYIKRHEDTFSNETYHDEVDVPEFEIEDTTDTDVLGTRSLIDVYESCNSVIKLESYMDASKHSEWIDAMKSEIEMIKKNNTWKLVDLQKGKNAIVIIVITAQRNWKIYHLDVKSAFINGELEEEFYVKQSEGFEVVGQEEKVYRLYKALYGLKQAPRAWYARVDAHLLNHNFRRSSSESTLYMKQFNSKERLIISLYVDDLLVIGSNDHLVKEFKKQMESEFDMSNMGLVSYFLGMEIKQLPNGVHISQRKYASDMLKKLRFLIWELQRVLRYVKGSLDLGIMFERNKVVKLKEYFDSDWAESIDDSKSTSDYIFTLGSGVFSWNSKKKSIITQSSAEAEYISVVGAVNHAIWIWKLLSDLDLTQKGPTVIFCDNKSAITIAENPV